MNDNIINLAIQVLPLGVTKAAAYKIIDKAIDTIRASKLKWEVSPFETVVEGRYSDVMELVERIQMACKEAGAQEIIINMKLQRSFEKDIAIDDKMYKYRQAY